MQAIQYGVDPATGKATPIPATASGVPVTGNFATEITALTILGRFFQQADLNTDLLTRNVTSTVVGSIPFVFDSDASALERLRSDGSGRLLTRTSAPSISTLSQTPEGALEESRVVATFGVSLIHLLCVNSGAVQAFVVLRNATTAMAGGQTVRSMASVPANGGVLLVFNSFITFTTGLVVGLSTRAEVFTSAGAVAQFSVGAA